MNRTPLIYGDELLKLIPQREPILMVDALYYYDPQSAETGLSICESNIFCEGETFSESGLIEHIAQSAAAFAGYESFLKNEKPHIGYIAEVSKMNISWLPSVGEDIRTRITLVSQAEGVTLMSASTSCGADELASCRLKIFMTKDENDGTE